MKKITLAKAMHKGNLQLTIGFSYDDDVKDHIRQFPNVRWSQTLQSFYVPFSKKTVNLLFDHLRKAGYFVDYDALKSNHIPNIKAVPKKRITIKGNPKVEVGHKIDDLKKWMRQKRYSANTIATYESMLLLFFGHYNDKSAADITTKEIENFNTDYILANDYSFTYQNQLISALKLFYSQDGINRLFIETVQRPRKQTKLPEVLSIEEVKCLLATLSNLKHKTLLSLLYACGLRIGETLAIKPQDLDLDRGFTHIKSGKGRKDRYVPVPRKMCSLLRKYIEAIKPDQYLFEGMGGAKYSPVSARQVLQRALRKSGIKKSVTLHTLRHSYATHLLENGTDIRYIQELLGHNSPKTTMLYTHVSSTSLDKIKNPFDEFEI